MSGLLSILLSGFIFYSTINTILTTKARAVETFPSLFVTEKETYPIGLGRNILLNQFQMRNTKLLQKGELNE